MIKVKTTGGWGTFAGTVSQAKNAVRVEGDKAVKKLADDAYTHILEDIVHKRLTLPPLSEPYASTKPPGRPIFINTQEYVLHLSVIRDQGGYRLGLKSGKNLKKGDSSRKVTRKRNKQASLEQVATYLEFGTSRMPARPHWRPTVEWVKTKVKDRGLEVLKDVFKT